MSLLLTKLRVLSLCFSLWDPESFPLAWSPALDVWRAAGLTSGPKYCTQAFLPALFFFFLFLFSLINVFTSLSNLLCKSECAGQFGAPYHCDITADGKMELARQHSLCNQFYTRRGFRDETQLLLWKFYIRLWWSWTTCMPIEQLPAGVSPAF